MIKKILLLLFLVIPGLKAQSYMNFDAMKLYDSNMIGFLKTLNMDMGSERVLVMQSVMKGIENKTDLVTFIFSDYKNKVSVRMITSNFIYSMAELKDRDIFDTKYLFGTGVTADEDRLKNTPYVLDPFKSSDVVMYFGGNTRFFFESGSPQNFVENKTKSKLRAQWVSLMKQKLLGIMKDFRKETLYNRRSNGGAVQIAKERKNTDYAD